MIHAIGAAHTRFALPTELSATEPPEARGFGRSDVRLLVAARDGLTHTRFTDLPSFLEPGDLLVVNTSATLPAAVDGRRGDGSPVTAHFSTEQDDGSWIVEVRAPDGNGPLRDARRGESVELSGGGVLTLTRAHPDRRQLRGSRLWLTRLAADVPTPGYLQRHGSAIRYGYVPRELPLAAYQTVFARQPGSAEMPSAGRPFTAELVTELVTRGVVVAPVLLHTGVSSLESGEAPQPERYDVPAATARLANQTRAAGGRVVAVGTTVTRALETATGADGTVQASAGWTDLVLGPRRRARVVDGLITGWHAPAASHLLLLEAVAGPAIVQQAYDAALAERYLWHEFGDSALLLAPPRPRSGWRTA